MIRPASTRSPDTAHDRASRAAVMRARSTWCPGAGLPVDGGVAARVAGFALAVCLASFGLPPGQRAVAAATPSGTAAAPATTPRSPRDAPSVETLAAQVVQDAAALEAAVVPWTEALDSAEEALAQRTNPALAAAAEALERARAARDAAGPRLAAAEASFLLLRRADSARRVFPPAVLAAASAFRGAAGASYDRRAGQVRLETAFRRAQSPPAAPGGADLDGEGGG